MKVELLSITPNAEELIENAGRTCYQSKPGENYKTGNLIKVLIKNGHDSVLEHSVATFRLSGISRNCTHQLVRHRLCSFSQKSQRYVKEDEFKYIIPKEIYELGNKKTNDYDIYKDYESIFKEHMSKINEMYKFWIEVGLKKEDARFVLPGACETEIVITTNMREWRSIFKVRCDKHAQWEIRELCLEILKQLYEKCPNIFEDLKEKFLKQD